MNESMLWSWYLCVVMLCVSWLGYETLGAVVAGALLNAWHGWVQEWIGREGHIYIDGWG